MNSSLPTIEELQKLPIRAVAAYAARIARRLSPALRGIVADAILDDVLRLLDTVLTTDSLAEVARAPLANSLVPLTDAYAAAPANTKSPENFLVVFCMIHAALAAMHAIEAAVDPASADHEMKGAAKEAQRATRTIGTLDNTAARAAAQAARQDYEVLLRVYGEHDEAVVGEPVDCFEKPS